MKILKEKTVRVTAILTNPKEVILLEKRVHYAMETKIEIGSWRDNEMNIKDFKWTREPDDYTLTDDKIEIITQHSASFSK